MKIIVDTREQRPLDFSSYDCDVERGTLRTGDYSVAGLEDRIALERKSLDDLVGSLTHGRARFERELQRGYQLDHFAVIVEANVADIRAHRYRSQAKPHAVMQSVITFQIRYRTPFVWGGNRENAAYFTFWEFEKYLRHVETQNPPTFAQLPHPAAPGTVQ